MKKTFIILLFILSLSAHATIYYVSTSGNNGNTGLDIDHPWQTLYYAETNADNPGDTIALKKGDTWALDNVLEINAGGSSGLPIIWDGSLWGTGANAIIQSNSDGGLNPKWYSLVHVAGCDYLIFQNITFDGNLTNRYGVVVGGNNSVYGPTAQANEDSIIVQNCNIIDVGDDSEYKIALLVQPWNDDMYNIIVKYDTINRCSNHGIAFYAGRFTEERFTIFNSYIGYNYIINCGHNSSARNHLFLNNDIDSVIVEHNVIIEDAGDAAGIAISSSVEDVTQQPRNIIIRYNNVRMDHSTAFGIYNGEDKSIDTYYNLFYVDVMENQARVIDIDDNGANGYTGAELNFYNNVIVVNDGAGIKDFSRTAGVVTFKNNIIFNNSPSAGLDQCIGIETAGSMVHSNNLLYRSVAGNALYVTAPTSYYRDNAETWEATIVKTDPLFDEVVADYDTLWLATGSPAIDAGVGVGLNLDYLGYTIDANPDIGAFEYGAGPPDDPPNLPTVTTNSTITIVYTRLARGGGNVTNDGGGSVYSRGLCWSTSVNPTINDNAVSCGSGTGAFSGYISNLAAGTTYYVQAWAINPTGIAYGGNYTFTTPDKSIAKSGGKILKYNGKILILK